MIIYLVSAQGHEYSGYGDGLIRGGHPKLLVSFLDYAGKPKLMAGFNLSDKTFLPNPQLKVPNEQERNQP